MSELYFTLQHGGGTHRVMIENQGDTTLISFGASFTLRLDEENLNKLREHIHDAARDMCIERRDTSDVWDDKVIEIEKIAELLHAEDHEVNAENEMVQAGIDAREARKAERSAQQSVDIWDPQDPINW